MPFWFLNSISFLFNFLLKYNICIEIDPDLEYTAQWIFTKWVHVGDCLGPQIKNRTLSNATEEPTYALLSLLHPLSALLPHSLSWFVTIYFFACFNLPFCFNIKVLGIDVKTKRGKGKSPLPTLPLLASYVFFQSIYSKHIPVHVLFSLLNCTFI